ncbi:MAG: DUF47 family protein [Pseudomonadales bacterium]|jgi:uncharacterized protein Yka (UPF0111/DUF47 family)|nr:DUF47 family protein [Pseudomonadales bacterium]
MTNGEGKRPESEEDGERPIGVLARLRALVLPVMADFHGLLVDQCRLTARGTSALVAFLRDDDPELGREVRRLEHEGDRAKARTLATLHRSFATPIDREDLYDAVLAIDEILNYAKTSVRELEVLELRPDAHMVEMATLVDAGAQALLEAFGLLPRDPEGAGREGERARKAEREIEKRYRAALAELFDPGRQLERLKELHTAGASPTELDQRSADTLVLVTQMLKRREIYRHLSNAGDHVAHAAQILEDIVQKAT